MITNMKVNIVENNEAELLKDFRDTMECQFEREL